MALERTEFLRVLSIARAQRLMLAQQTSMNVHGELPLYRQEVYREALRTGLVSKEAR